MKKLIPFFICLLLCVPSFGQNQLDTEMSVSYGFFSNSKPYTVLSRIFGSVGPEFLRAYTETGVGEQGALVAGLRYRF